jgi:two-component system, chemotaxis family, CheB/CheR fusion protein
MALHELTTNAVKHGALSVPVGMVKIDWHVTSINGGPVLQFGWIESGGPVVEKPSSRGFGLQLIEHGLGSDLDADVHLDFHPDGVRFTLRFPIEPSRG